MAKESFFWTGTLYLKKSQQAYEASQYSYTIDFENLEDGSDLWLFSKTTDLKRNFGKMSVLLTPSFEGKVWYEKDFENYQLHVFATADSTESSLTEELEVSYRLSAPRFDYLNWSNTRTDAEGGFDLDNLKWCKIREKQENNLSKNHKLFIQDYKGNGCC